MIKRLVVIDGHAILHRAYHALPPLTAPDGTVVNSVYGFASMLLRVIHDLKPEYLMVAFDHAKPTFRKKLFKEYQSQRPEMDKNLVSQIDLVKRMVDLMGISVYGLDGYEADDVIGTITQQAEKSKEKNNLETVIVTGDRDILQLANEKVKVYMPVKGLSESKLYGMAEVEDKFGVKPSQMVDYKGLVGDPSDNYPGVAGIGPKTAVDLIKKFATVEAIYQNLDKIEGKLKEKLLAGKENAFLSKQLATIVCDAPVEIDIAGAKLTNLDRPAVISFFEEMEFRSLIPRLSSKKEEAVPKSQKAAKKKQDNSKQTSLF